MSTFKSLLAARLAEASKPFLARGASLQRCGNCQLALPLCICAQQPNLPCRHEFVLVMHRDEVFKPSNTGRWVEACLPQSTKVYCWDRLQPDPELIQNLADPRFQNLIVFPNENNVVSPEVPARKNITELNGAQTYRFILLDGTWRQASRMFRFSQWLKGFDTLQLPVQEASIYSARKAHKGAYLSTFEAALQCLQLTGDREIAETMLTFFIEFNQRYRASRGREVATSMYLKE